MFRSTVMALAIAALPLIAASPITPHAQAQAPKAAAKSPDDVAASLPIDIPEVISGGGWQAGGQAGIYRALVVVTPTQSSSQARVYVQWIGVKATGGTPEVVRTLAIKDIADRNLPNAQLSLEADAENEAVIVVSSFDPQANKQSTFAYKVTLPGQVTKTAVPAGYGSQSPPPAGGPASSQKK